jgi:hypothetical protein
MATGCGQGRGRCPLVPVPVPEFLVDAAAQAGEAGRNISSGSAADHGLRPNMSRTNPPPISLVALFLMLVDEKKQQARFPAQDSRGKTPPIPGQKANFPGPMIRLISGPCLVPPLPLRQR